MVQDASAAARPAESMMARLKADTAQLHARIEQVVPLLRPDLELGLFRSHLAAVLGFVAPLEARLGHHAEGLLAWGVRLDERRRASLLVEDLVDLGDARAAVAALPACDALPSLGSLDEAWGCLYVLEGSTLGGQVLQRQLAPRLGLSPHHGLRYFAGHGARTAERWKELGASLERYAAAGCDRDAVVRGARQTFETQMAWLAARAPRPPSPEVDVG